MKQESTIDDRLYTSPQRAAAWIVRDMWRPNVLRAGRAEQISAKARMAYRAVADDIDERGLAGLQSTFEGRAKLLKVAHKAPVQPFRGVSVCRCGAHAPV